MQMQKSKSLAFVVGCFLLLSSGLSANHELSPADTDKRILAITYYHYPPKLLVINGQPSGIYVDQLEDVAKRAGYKINWIFSDIDEEAKMLDDGRRAFCTTGRMPTKERAERWAFLPYLFDVAHKDTILTRADMVEKFANYNSIADVALDTAFKGTLLRSGIYGDIIDQLLESKPSWINLSGATDLQMMKMVLAGRADWTIVPHEQWLEAQKLDREVSQLAELKDFGALSDYPIYIACSKALNQDVLNSLAIAMEAAGFERGEMP